MACWFTDASWCDEMRLGIIQLSVRPGACVLKLSSWIAAHARGGYRADEDYTLLLPLVIIYRANPHFTQPTVPQQLADLLNLE